MEAWYSASYFFKQTSMEDAIPKKDKLIFCLVEVHNNYFNRVYLPCYVLDLGEDGNNLRFGMY